MISCKWSSRRSKHWHWRWLEDLRTLIRRWKLTVAKQCTNRMDPISQMRLIWNWSISKTISSRVKSGLVPCWAFGKALAQPFQSSQRRRKLYLECLDPLGRLREIFRWRVNIWMAKECHWKPGPSTWCYASFKIRILWKTIFTKWKKFQLPIYDNIILQHWLWIEPRITQNVMMTIRTITSTTTTATVTTVTGVRKTAVQVAMTITTMKTTVRVTIANLITKD